MQENIKNQFVGKHILVVDDVPAVSEFLNIILTSEGYKVTCLDCGEKAIEYVAQNEVDLILLDVLMDGIDGFETCRQLKSDDITRHVPVIFVTAKGDTQDVVEGFQVGAVDFLVKPLRKEDVCIRVQTQLKVRAFIQSQQSQIIQAEKLASLAELMGEFSHELETPIGIILTAQTHLASRLESFRELMNSNQLTKSKLTNFIDTVEDSTKLTISNINRAIERTSSFKRLSVDQCSETRRHFNLHNYLHHIELALRSKFINTDHSINIKCEDEITIDSFPGALSQVVINLINNALIHAFEGIDSGEIELKVIRNDDGVSIIFRDNGRGIEAEQLPKIFSQYYTSKPQEGGTGLGLYLVKTIVEKKLMGRLECSSEVGKGTVFVIDLPYQ